MMTLPPMGWNSWYVTSLTTTDTQLKAQMDAMVSTGLLAAGYNIAGFTEPLPYARDSTGGATISHLFVSSPGQTCTYAHGLGLLCGWYTGPHATTCGGGVGSYGWDRQDVAAYAAAGVDEIFYDGSCTTSYAAQTALYGASATARTISQNFGQLLLASGRNIAWELSITGNSSTWWPLVGSNITRVGTDSMHTWANIDGYFTQFASLSAYQSVGYACGGQRHHRHRRPNADEHVRHVVESADSDDGPHHGDGPHFGDAAQLRRDFGGPRSSGADGIEGFPGIVRFQHMRSLGQADERNEQVRGCISEPGHFPKICTGNCLGNRSLDC